MCVISTWKYAEMRLSIPYYYSSVVLLTSRGFAAYCSVSRLVFTPANWDRPGFHQTRRNRLLSTANKPYTSLSGSEQFNICLIQTEKDFESVVIDALVKEG